MSSFEQAPDTPEPRKPEDLAEERELAFIGLDRKLLNLATKRMVHELEWWANLRAPIQRADENTKPDPSADGFVVEPDKSKEYDDPNLKAAGTLIDFQLPGDTVKTDAQYALQLELLGDARYSTLAEYTIGIALYEEILLESQPHQQSGEWQGI